MLDYKKPKGIIRKLNCSHPVLGGWMTNEENEISTANIYTPSKLPKSIRTKLEQWRKDKAVLDAEEEIAEAGHNALRDMLASIARKKYENKCHSGAYQHYIQVSRFLYAMLLIKPSTKPLRSTRGKIR